MTLFKQIVILLSFFVLILLLSIMSLNFKSASEYVQEQLYTDAQDTAASLSLSLGSAQGDEATMSTMINAVFDSGYYRHITLTDMQGNTLYKRESETASIDVPQWFLTFVALKVPSASAQVSSGWSPIAILEVTSLENNAYVQLYETFNKLLASFITISFIAFVLLYLLLHIVLKSVKKVQQQAEAISDNEFFTNDEIPFTSEFRDATIAMNTMVLKVKEIFTKEAKTLKQYHQLLYKDPVTNLANRRLLTLRLGEYIRSESKKSEGTLFFMAFEGLAHLNDTLGHQEVDKLLKTFSALLSSALPQRTNTLAARLNGTEFALLIPTLHAEESKHIAKEISLKTEMLLQEHRITSLTFHTSIIEYHSDDSLTDIFTKADYGLARCKQQESFSIFFEHDDAKLKRLAKHEWSALIAEALEEGRLALAIQPVLCNGTPYHEEVYLRLKEKDGTVLPAGSFLPVAHTLEMDVEIDKYTIDKVLASHYHLEHSIAINISSRFIKESASLQWLEKRLQESRPLKPLFFELSNNETLASIESCVLFAKMLKRHGHYFGIDKFTVHNSDLKYLQQIKPAYIKVDQGYLTDIMISHHSGIENNALHIIMESLNITLIATAIEDEESRKRMQTIGVKCFEGRHIATRYDMKH